MDSYSDIWPNQRKLWSFFQTKLLRSQTFLRPQTMRGLRAKNDVTMGGPDSTPREEDWARIEKKYFPAIIESEVKCCAIDEL